MEMTIEDIDRMTEKMKEKYRTNSNRDEFIDPLTRIPNKRALEDDLIFYTFAMIKGKKLNEQNKNDDATFSLIYCDISNLKTLNDKFKSHSAGDYGIRKIVHIIKSIIRESDFLYRLHEGGDEFVIILPRCTKEQASVVRERITEAIEYELGIVADLALAMGIVDTNDPRLIMPEELDEDNKNLTAYFNRFVELSDLEMNIEKKELPKKLSEEKKQRLVVGPALRLFTMLGLDPESENDRATFTNDINSALDTYLKTQMNIEKIKQDKKVS